MYVYKIRLFRSQLYAPFAILDCLSLSVATLGTSIKNTF